jgi:hypothetical protein
VTSANLSPTAILDYQTPAVAAFVAGLSVAAEPSLRFLRAAHQAVARRVAPIYTLQERQPVSVTLARGRGSCSQRLACWEAAARAAGIPTRVRGLWMDVRFWRRRFPLSWRLFPGRVLLAWPDFFVGGRWLAAQDVFGDVAARAGVSRPFANDAETLFEALRSAAVDLGGRSCGSACDLSGFVLAQAGLFDTRDQLWDALGTLAETWRGRLFELGYAGRLCDAGPGHAPTRHVLIASHDEASHGYRGCRGAGVRGWRREQE